MPSSRPLLFRSTSRQPLAAFHVKHPHANVLSADAFARGLIRSGTDYSVYTPQMQGLDLAFYTGRSRYHTKFDSIPHLEGGRRALWAMMESAWGAGQALLDAPDGGNSGDAVYFDLFAAALMVFSQTAMRVYDIVFLAIVPVLVLAERVVQRRHVITWDWTWTRFWLALILTVGAQVGLVAAYVWLNPYIGYSAPYLVVLSFFTLAYVALSLPLALPKHAHAQKQTVLLQTLILAYILLLLGTIFLPHIGGTYPLSAWAGCTFLAWAVGAVEGLFATQSREDEHDEVEVERRLVSGIRYDAVEGAEGEVEGEEVQTEPTEITPLIQQRRPQNGAAHKDETTEGGAIGWWIAQMLLVVPIPVILVAHVGVMFIGSMAQTLGDGGGVVVRKFFLPSFLLETNQSRSVRPTGSPYAPSPSSSHSVHSQGSQRRSIPPCTHIRSDGRVHVGPSVVEDRHRGRISVFSRCSSEGLLPATRGDPVSV